MIILISRLSLRWERAPALSEGRTLFLLMLGRVRRGTALYPDVFHQSDFWSHLLQVTGALCAAWGSCFFCTAALGTLVLLCNGTCAAAAVSNYGTVCLALQEPCADARGRRNFCSDCLVEGSDGWITLLSKICLGFRMSYWKSLQWEWSEHRLGSSAVL